MNFSEEVEGEGYPREDSGELEELKAAVRSAVVSLGKAAESA